MLKDNTGKSIWGQKLEINWWNAPELMQKKKVF